MSNLTDFFPSGGGGGLTPKFQEFNSSGTFTPTQALIDAGGYIEIFLVGAGGLSTGTVNGGGGGEVLIKKMYLTSTNSCTVTIGAGVSATANGNSSSFLGGSAGGEDLTAIGGRGTTRQVNMMGAGFASYSSQGSAGSGVLGYAAGGSQNMGVQTAKVNSGQGAQGGTSGSGYCLIKWYE